MWEVRPQTRALSHVPPVRFCGNRGKRHQGKQRVCQLAVRLWSTASTHASLRRKGSNTGHQTAYGITGEAKLGFQE